MSDVDERSESRSGAVLVTLPPDLYAAVQRAAAANFSSEAQVCRQATAWYMRHRGELPPIALEAERVAS
jgi:hypothetical protein